MEFIGLLLLCKEIKLTIYDCPDFGKNALQDIIDKLNMNINTDNIKYDENRIDDDDEFDLTKINFNINDQRKVSEFNDISKDRLASA